MVDARDDKCIGSKRPQMEKWFSTEMHGGGRESDVMIGYHQLCFANLATKQAVEGTGAGGIIPEFEAVVFDEAHELEDVAGSYFGVAVSNLKVDDLIRDVEIGLKQKNALTPGVVQACGG